MIQILFWVRVRLKSCYLKDYHPIFLMKFEEISSNLFTKWFFFHCLVILLEVQDCYCHLHQFWLLYYYLTKVNSNLMICLKGFKVQISIWTFLIAWCSDSLKNSPLILITKLSCSHYFILNHHDSKHNSKSLMCQIYRSSNIHLKIYLLVGQQS